METEMDLEHELIDGMRSGQRRHRCTGEDILILFHQMNDTLEAPARDNDHEMAVFAGAIAG
jgi:hypothetical protein